LKDPAIYPPGADFVYIIPNLGQKSSPPTAVGGLEKGR